MNIEPNGHSNLIEEARTLLSAYIDNEVTVTERQLVENALSSSVDLKRELAALQQTISLFQDLPLAKAPKPFTLTEADVDIASTQHKTKSSGWFYWGQWWKPAFGGAIALTAAILVGLFLFNQNSVSEQSTTAMIAQAPAASALEVAPTIEGPQSKMVEADSANSRSAPQVNREVAAEDEASSDAAEEVMAVDVTDTQEQLANRETTPVDQPVVSSYNEQAAEGTGELVPNPLNRDSFQLQQDGSASEIGPGSIATTLPAPFSESTSDTVAAKVTADEANDVVADAPSVASEPLAAPPIEESAADSDAPFVPLASREVEVTEPDGFVIERQLILVQRPTLAILGVIRDAADNPLNDLYVRVRSADFCLVSGPSGSASGLVDGAYNIEFTDIVLPAEWQVSVGESVEISPALSCEDDFITLSQEFGLLVNEVAEIRLDWRKVE